MLKIVLFRVSFKVRLKHLPDPYWGTAGLRNTNNLQRLIADMSMTILHHGHVRLLKKASELGYLILGLTSDEDILKHKGFVPKLSFENRREIGLSIRWVNEVLKCPWPISDEFMNAHNIDFLVRGDLDFYDDNPKNFKPISRDRIILLERTPNISSTILRL